MTIIQKARAKVNRLPHWAVDGLLGLGMALIVMTVANAALPGKPVAPPAPVVEPQSVVEDPAINADPLPTPAEPVAPALQPVAAISFGRPVEGYPVVSPFGVRQLPWEGAGRLHAGVDIAAPSGSPVRAVADGVVVSAGWNGGYGRYVQLRHAGGLYTLYAHLSTWSARLAPGAPVSAGEQIAQVGSTGSSTGAHLHFEIRDPGGRPLNPQFFMNREFASVDDLPIAQAARVTGPVRIAYVSGYPRGRRAAASQNAGLVRGPDGRGVQRRILPSGAMVIHLGG